MKYRTAKPLTVHCQPNSVDMTCVTCVITNMPIADPDATMPTAKERHFTKYGRITKQDEFQINMCPNPDKQPYVMHIIHSSDENEAKRKPIVPADEPNMVVNL